MKKSIIAFISLITLCIEPLMASAEFSFKKYQVENGLSHNTTWCAIQDSYGFLWIGGIVIDGEGSKVICKD